MTMIDTEIDVERKGYTAPKEHFIYRLKFTKGEEVKFIGHLDIMRLFQRANKRAKLPMAYSKGFNPHQILSFASPLTLGTTSEGEYGDFELAEKIEPQVMIDALNEVLPDGVRVLDGVLIVGKTDSAMASIDGALYEIYPDEQMTKETLERILPDYLAQKEILVTKKTKRSDGIADIREDIFSLKQKEKHGKVVLELFCASGSRRNLKPEPVIQSIYEFAGIPFGRFAIHYHRVELFRTHEEALVGLAEGIGTRSLKGEETE